MRRVFGLVSLTLVFALSHAEAQDPAGCTAILWCTAYSLYNVACLPIMPASAYDCINMPNDGTYCKVHTNQCPAPPKCLSCAQTGKPIDLATGDTYITETDIRLPGLGGGLTLTRTWNSQGQGIGGPSLGLFGSNWISTYEERIAPSGNGYMEYGHGDGNVWSFGYSGRDNSGNPTFTPAAPANKTATLIQAPTQWTLSFQNGETRTFDVKSGFLTSISDRNGNTTQIAYDASNRLATVTDPGGRHLYFSYATPGSFMITGVSSDFGVSLSYSYDGTRLTKVTKPDSTTISFQYDSHGFISAVLDNNGKILESHTYDSLGRGLSSSRAGGAEAVTVSYPQPPTSPPVMP